MANQVFAGFLYTAAGAAVNGATVDLFDRNTTTPVRATTTTDASGYWTISHATEGRFDVRITNGASISFLKYDDQIQIESIETAVLRVRNPADTFDYDIVPSAITADRQLNLPLITATDTLVVLALAQTLTNKTLTSPIVGTQVTLDQTTADYTLTWADPAAARAISIPDPLGTDVFVFRDMTQTLINKQMTTIEVGHATDTTLSRASAGVLAVEGVTLSDANHTTPAASTTAVGHAELAIASEINTGTDATRAVTPDALAGSVMGEVVVQMVVFGFTTDVATGDGKFYLHIDNKLAGMDLVRVHAEVITAGTTGTMTIQIANVDAAVDMLSTLLSIDTAETGSDTAATPAVINAANDDVQLNEVLRVDVDAIHTTAAKGLIVTLVFRLP